MIYDHYSKVPWDSRRWPHFNPYERFIHCPCCGEFYYDEGMYDSLEVIRVAVRSPININSGHRCPFHNARVGGRPLSQHKKLAFDISIRNHDLQTLLQAAQSAGFTGFGFYQTFLHVDKGRRRQWSTKGGRKVWESLIL